METWDSLVKVMHGATTLVAIGDPMFGPVTIDGSQAVQVAELVRAAGIKAYPRGNERHTVEMTVCKEHDSVATALKNAFTAALNAPRTMADVDITFADGSGIRVKNASVESWQAGHDAHLGRTTLRIIGGEIAAIAAP